ncbi:LLM class flavin-dependent oxidoreductase [Paenibacillus arenilitoris]|uniref:LLM class flavin-dependent oxidoreductase n=1 Tax=Paenibacillus arenilitoris TaxID=2772299 RepID=A0A927H7I1_9BACL|nr:LLM class flavin-dependent oxidoreductase [Paenibacillus arenilitoris]MBD2870557.1 LLM class flavin-dependent oxidoreductase [Paenibacillus arenilitoris]
MSAGGADRKLILTAALDGPDYARCVRQAQIAEQAGFHAVVAPESSDFRLGGNGEPEAALEPFSLLAALSAGTASIGLIAEVHAAYNEPYHIARKLGALDYMSRGRAGCHIAPGPAAAAGNFGRTGEGGPGPRLLEAEAAATEFAEALRLLWDSWEDDALVYDKRAGVQMDEGKVREIDYAGRYYAVKGPLNIARPPQGQPPVLFAVTGARGRSAAAKEADAAVAPLLSTAEAALMRADMRARMVRNGRRAEDLRLLAELCPVVAETNEEARELEHRLRQAFGAASERLIFAGTAAAVADRIEAWFRQEAIDGFHIAPLPRPDLLPAFAAKVVPELRRRGLFRAGGETSTLRSGLGLARPNNVFATLKRRGGSD